MSSLIEGFGVSTKSEEEIAIEAMFPTNNPLRKLQMLTELQPKVINPMSVLGVIRRRFRSSVLSMYQEEYSTNQIARERKGRIEIAEVVASSRRLKDDGPSIQ